MDLISILPKLTGLLIPIVAITMPILIVLIVLHYRQRQREKLFETVKLFADRGMPVPRELLDPPKAPEVLGSARFRAITLIGTGVGLALMFWMLNLEYLTGIGALLVCIGTAQLIAVRLDRAEQLVPPGAPHDGQR